MKTAVIGSYHDADGARHELVVRETADGGWLVLDSTARRAATVSARARTGARRRRRSPATT